MTENWRQGLLFGCGVFVKETPPNEQSKKFDFNAPTFNLLKFNVLGMPFQSTSWPDLVQDASDLVKQRVAHFALLTTRFREFEIVLVVAKLTREFLHELLTQGSAEQTIGGVGYRKLVSEVIDALLPSRAGRLVEQDSEYRVLDHVLYLEPNAPLVGSDDFEPGGSGISLVAKLAENLNAPVNIAPVVLEDVILFGSLSNGDRAKSCVAVRLSPLAGGELSISLPLVPVQFMNHTAICVIQDEYSAKFEALISNTDSYWNLHQTWSSFAAYRTEFMAERLRVSKLLLKAQELRTNIDKNLPTGHVYSERYVELGHAFPVRSEYLAIVRKHVSTNIRQRREGSDQSLADFIDLTKERLSGLDSFLRDAATVDSTNQNLMLGASVKRLTWAVIGLTIVSLAIGVLSDTAKEKLVRTLAPQVVVEWLLEPA